MPPSCRESGTETRPSRELSLFLWLCDPRGRTATCGHHRAETALEQMCEEVDEPGSRTALSACKWELTEAAQELKGFVKAVSLDLGC